MKILYVCSDLGIPVLGRKGAAVHVREMISALSRQGHSVILATSKLNKSPWEIPENLDSPLLHISLHQEHDTVILRLKSLLERTLGQTGSLPGELRRLLYNIDLETQLSRQFQENPPDVIYERASLYSSGGVSLAQKLNVPIILELNSPLALEQSTYRSNSLGSLGRDIELWTLCQADAVVTVSSLLRDHITSLGVCEQNVSVLPNGVNPQLFSPRPANPDLRSRWNLGDGPILGFVGGLRPWHGLDVLPSLLERLVPEFPKLRVMIIGDGPLRNSLEPDLEKRSLKEHVIFTGWVPHQEVPDLIRLFDLALAPYQPLDHSFYFSPLKLFECMGCGIPVVAPRLGQIAEVVEHERTGLLFNSGDLDGLAESCMRLLTHDAFRQDLGRAAAEHIHQFYTWDHNAIRVVELAHKLKAEASVK